VQEENYLYWDAVDNAIAYKVSGYISGSQDAFSCSELPQSVVKTVETNSYKIPTEIFPCYKDWTVKTICDDKVEARLSTDLQKIEAQIYPNPTTDRTTVQFSESLTTFNAQLYRTDGALLVNKDYQNTDSFEIDLVQYPAGIYILHIQIGQELLVRKVVKQ